MEEPVYDWEHRYAQETPQGLLELIDRTTDSQVLHKVALSARPSLEGSERRHIAANPHSTPELLMILLQAQDSEVRRHDPKYHKAVPRPITSVAEIIANRSDATVDVLNECVRLGHLWGHTLLIAVALSNSAMPQQAVEDLLSNPTEAAKDIEFAYGWIEVLQYRENERSKLLIRFLEKGSDPPLAVSAVDILLSE